ncbi:hypothetical protein LCGC14_0826740 [marine sediment metagenome]|uniref:Uncharacterized protein n=1 Tax=marine sediment metagenome TaxID=412755 RepID=A0A0F9PH52_9ZZZZ
MSRKRRYTEAVHARRVQKVIEKPNPQRHCPAQPRYERNSLNGFEVWEYVWEEPRKTVCTTCKGFIGMEYNYGCPCVHLGVEEAIKRTWLALEQKGYL